MSTFSKKILILDGPYTFPESLGSYDVLTFIGHMYVGHCVIKTKGINI